MSSDPIADETYQNLTLCDFIKYLSPQISKQREEIIAINDKGFAPLYDPLFKETMPVIEEPKYENRHQRRQELLIERKAVKKAAKKACRKLIT